MANTLVYPTTMSLNGYTFGNSTIAGSTAAIVNPTTANTYQVRLDQGSLGYSGDAGKVGLLVIWVAASSSGYLRVQIAGSASSDYLGWQGGLTRSTDVKTFYSPMTSAAGLTAASSTEYLFLGPFDSAKVGRLSTAGYKVMNVTFDACGTTQESGSTLSTTFSVVVSTIKMIAFQMA